MNPKHILAHYVKTDGSGVIKIYQDSAKNVQMLFLDALSVLQAIDVLNVIKASSQATYKMNAHNSFLIVNLLLKTTSIMVIFLFAQNAEMDSSQIP